MIHLVRSILLIFLLHSIDIKIVSAQCFPPMAEICDESSVLCSLDELNGYSCNNPSSLPSLCSPLCSQGGVGHNTSWWGFVTRGGDVSITINIGGCTTAQGVQFGIWGDCICSEEILCRSIPCVPPNSVQTMNVFLKPCKTYYLFVDGCSGDICDFTLSTSSDTSPTLKPLSFINNDSDKIIGPLCQGVCNASFFVNPQPGGCEPTYVWTLNGNKIGANSNKINLDFPDPGSFVLCIAAYIGNPNSGSICSLEGPQCATVKITKTKVNVGRIRTVCWELINGGSRRDSNCVFKIDGTYRCEYKDSNCCTIIDSGEYNVLDPPQPPEVYYITCNNEPYIDILGRAHSPCLDHFEISLPKTSDPYRCDSSIILTAINVEFEPRWRVQCIGGMVEISPNISIIKACNVNETYQFEYRWYKKFDPVKKTISTDERLIIDAIKVDYCLDVYVRVQLETEFALCAKTFCETFNESDLAAKKFPLAGENITCINGIGNYWIDTFISQKVTFYSWTIDGGIVVSKPDSQGVEVKWLLPPGDTGTVCVFYNTECGQSPETCMNVTFSNESAGKDSKVKSLNTKLNSTSNKPGMWTMISGPGTVVYENVKNPKTRMRVNEYGKYCFEWKVNETYCSSKDTVCIEFFKIKTTDPDFPNRIFDDRNNFTPEEEYIPIELFTPNLISNLGKSFVSINGEINSPIKYSWFDIYGRIISNERVEIEPEMQRVTISAPLQEGFYFLVLEVNGEYSARKVCVIN